jgi:GH43 family beta-xylosidase
MTISRRSFLAATAIMPISGRVLARPGQPVLRNPLIRQRADAQIFRHTDGVYYMTASVPEYDRLVLRRAASLAGLAEARESVLWRRPAAGRLAGSIWAPELHRFNDQWHMYFAAGDSDDKFRIRTYAISGDGLDPFATRWSGPKQLETPWDTFTLDSTSFVHRGVRYLCWAQKEPGIDTNSNLYLAPLATATTLAQTPVRLSVPTLGWEIQGFKVNEGPALLERHGRLFLTYSASATDARYCMGMLTAHADADIMRAKSWVKSPVPVFRTSQAHHIYGPGHNSFTVDERGRDMLVYHARDYARIKGDPLFDPNRHTRVQPIHYRADGTPDFGEPLANGVLRQL